MVFKQEADSFPPLVQLEQCSPPHRPDAVSTTFSTDNSSAELHSDPHAANRSMKATFTGSGTTTGSDIILAGHHLQVAVEQTEAEKVKRERTDRRSLDGGGLSPSPGGMKRLSADCLRPDDSLKQAALLSDFIKGSAVLTAESPTTG